MLIKRIKAKNFKTYLNLDLDISVEQDKPIILIGGAACLSTHWPGIFNNHMNPIPDAFIAYLQTNLPDKRKHKLYFDHGTTTLDSLYAIHQDRVDVLMRNKGWSKRNWMSRVFPGTDHSEKAWAARLDIPMMFLLSR